MLCSCLALLMKKKLSNLNNFNLVWQSTVLKMSKLDLCRTTRFVSLDTHPANNSLVVSYEILVLIREPTTGRELCRRSKRDQFQVNIAALDQLNDKTPTTGGTLRRITLNMHQLSEEILARCPILAEANRPETLEDIQLNLLYLINRKQAQLANPIRPPSSTSTRLRSGTPSSSGRLVSARQGSASITRTKDSPAQKSDSSENPLEVYQCYCEKELKLARRHDYLDYERLEAFVSHLDEHLMELEDELQLDRLPKNQLEDLETQLENLYGEPEERRCSMAIIRRFVRDNEKLMKVGSNRLLVCAILRILRDNEGTSMDRSMSESILYCLIRFTSFEDVFSSMAFGEAAISGDNESLDLVRVIIDMLDNHIKWLQLNCENDLRLMTSNSFYTNSLLVVLANILRLDSDAGAHHRIKQRIIQQHGTKLADILSVCLALSAKHMARDIRTSNKSHERLTVTLLEVLSIFKQFSIFKEFVNIIRATARIQPLVDSLVAILNVLQLSRPGSGSNQLQQVLVGDRATLFKIYELELELMSVVDNLIYDPRFRTRFTRNNLLLKCVLRSLVLVLAASRKSNTLNPFNGSQVLIVPLKCLYELSCNDKIKRELFESRVIVKCLLEYLLSSSSDMRTEIDTCKQDLDYESPGKTNTSSRLQLAITELDLNEGDQIVLSSQEASQYIVSLWMNLSSKCEAPFYRQSDEESSGLLQDYIQLAITNLEQFALIVAALTNGQIGQHLLRPMRHMHLMNYVHTKLIRNVTQFLAPTSMLAVDKLITVVGSILNQEQQVQLGTFVPLLVECLASLTNVIEKLTDDQIVVQSQKLGTTLAMLFDLRRPPLIDSSPSTEVESDDLLLVAINFLGCVARRSEICAHLKMIQDNLLRTINLVLELRTIDTEMIICCLFTLNQLVNHTEFLQNLGSSLDEAGEHSPPKQLLAHQLVELLSSLAIHPNPFVVELCDQVLNKLKQFEELHSLADSVTCQKRFVSYNSKWLNAIRANREDSSDGELTDAEQELAMAARLKHNNGSSTNDEEEELDLDEYRQLRTINAEDTRTWSRLTSNSSVSRPSSRFLGSRSDRRQGLDGAGEEEEEGDDDDDDEEDENTSSEPDVNVIDSMSMIGHLTNRREMRGELARR